MDAVPGIGLGAVSGSKVFNKLKPIITIGPSVELTPSLALKFYTHWKAHLGNCNWSISGTDDIH